MRMHIVIHESFESPAAIEIWAKEKGCLISYTHLYANEQLPANCDAFDFLVIMGGPQSPKTTMQECSYFDAKKETNLIRQAIDSEKLVLGVCLGAQLIGEALGASFTHSPNKEIGIFNIELTHNAQSDEIFSKFPKNFYVGHWHNDMPGLTTESKILATSEGCPRQIIRYALGVYGFQCHFEFTPESIESMIKHCGNEFNDAHSSPYIQEAAKIKTYDFRQMNTLLFTFLDHMQTLHELKNKNLPIKEKHTISLNI